MITDQSERNAAHPVRSSDRPPRLQRRLFPSSDSSSQYEEEGWRPANREDSRGSEAGTTESWEFKSTLEAPIARLESLDELETSQVRKNKRITKIHGLVVAELKCLIQNYFLF